jgi:O-antigen/teichoic acid export membrane protein
MFGSKIFSSLKQYSNPIILGSGNLVSSIIAGALWLVIATIVTTEEYGEINYYLSIATLGSTLSVFGLNLVVTTFVAKGNDQVIGQSNAIVLILSAIATNRASQFVLAIIFYYILGVPGVILGYSIPLLALGTPFFLHMKNASIGISELRAKKQFTLHSFSLSVSQAVSFYADKIIIGPLFGFAVLGLYQLGFQFLMILSILPGSLYQYLLPQEAKGVETRSLRKYGMAMAVALAAVMIVTIPFVIRTFFPKYIDAIAIGQIMILGVIPLTFNALMNTRLLGSERSSPVVLAAVSYVTVSGILLYFLGTLLGGIGLAIATVVALSAQSSVLWLKSRSSQTEDRT